MDSGRIVPNTIGKCGSTCSYNGLPTELPYVLSPRWIAVEPNDQPRIVNSELGSHPAAGYDRLVICWVCSVLW